MARSVQEMICDSTKSFHTQIPPSSLPTTSRDYGSLDEEIKRVGTREYITISVYGMCNKYTRILEKTIFSVNSKIWKQCFDP